MFSISLTLEPDSPFTFSEVTVNPFVMSPANVDMWCEVVLLNEGTSSSAPPMINARFTYPVLVQCRTQRIATSYRSRLLRADTPSQLLDYLPVRDLNEAMYAELWYSFLDLASPRKQHIGARPSDLFGRVYATPLRRIQNLDTFLDQINYLTLARCGIQNAWTVTGRISDVTAVQIRS